MTKDKQKKHEAADATAASGKMSRKEFEKELTKLQVELTRLQTWVKDKGARPGKNASAVLNSKTRLKGPGLTELLYSSGHRPANQCATFRRVH
jgi:hypothetical protein